MVAVKVVEDKEEDEEEEDEEEEDEEETESTAQIVPSIIHNKSQPLMTWQYTTLLIS